MQNATEKFYPDFITPMAAVAGSVADNILNVLVKDSNLEKAYVNNGGSFKALVVSLLSSDSFLYRR